MRLQIKRYGAVALAGIMAGSFALTGCGSYASSSELRLQAEASLSGQADSGNGTGQDSRREPGSGTQDGQGGRTARTVKGRRTARASGPADRPPKPSAWRPGLQPPPCLNLSP